MARSSGPKFGACRRDVGLRAIEADVTLALLLGIIERMRVQEGPDELAADVFQAEFEMGVLDRRCDGRRSRLLSLHSLVAFL